MAPSRYKAGATDVETGLRSALVPWVLVAATEWGICAIEFTTHQSVDRAIAGPDPMPIAGEDDPTFSTWVAQVTAFIETPAADSIYH